METEYKYVTYLLKTTNIANHNNANYYDLISVVFMEPHTHKYVLKKYNTQIKMPENNINIVNLIETHYLIEIKYEESPYVVVKFTNNKYGYIHTENFDPIEFDDQETIKNKLLNFYLHNNSL